MEEGKLKISFKAHGIKQVATMSDAAGLEEIYNVVNAMVIGITFTQDQIDNHILDLAEQIKRNEKK